MIENSKSIRELVRIRWRSLVLSLPGGVLWLCVVARAAKWKEQDIGPHRCTYPPETLG